MVSHSLSHAPISPPARPQASEVLSVLSANGVIRFATPATAGFYGYELDEIVGRSALRFIAPESRDAITAQWEALRHDPALDTDDMLLTMVAANGRRIPIRASIWRLPGRDEYLLIHHVVEHLRERLDTLYSILAAVSGTLDLDEVLDTVLREAHRLIPCERSTITIRERDDRLAVRRWHRGEIESYHLPLREIEQEFKTSQIMRQTGQPIIIDDTETDPRWVRLADSRPIRSWLGAPLIDGGEFLGELNLDSPEPGAFNLEDAQLAHALARQVAVALRNARQFDDQQRRAKRYRILNEVTQAISQLNLRDVLELIYRKVSELMDTTTFFIGLYHPEMNMVHLVGSYDHGQPSPDKVQNADDGITGLVLRARASLIIHDSDVEPLPDVIIIQDEAPRSLLMMPLLAQDEIVGVISVQSYKPHAYAPEDIDMLETIAGSVATAIRNAQLYAQALERLNALETLRAMSVSLAGAQDPDSVSELFIHAALDLFQPGEARLCLCVSSPWEPKTWVGRATGDTPHFAIEASPAGDQPPLIVQVAQDCQPVILPDLSVKPALRGEFQTPWPPEALAVYPIQRQERLFAVLALIYPAPRFFGQDMLRTLDLLCLQAATAFENVRFMITLRQRADELAAANASLQAQDELRRELVYQVSHDLRSPLQIVYGYADMLYNAELGPITPMQKDVLGLMIKRTQAIEGMTRDIMAARPINRDLLDLQNIDLNQLCQQAVVDAKMLCDPDQGIDFETALAPGSLAIDADYNRLNRVLDNLLGNAIKFSPDGGIITLRTERDTANRRALVSIADQGIGIPADHLPFVFERFFRGNRKRFKGSGLGLYITQQIVAAHQGDVWVASQEGAGSTVTVALPLAER
jgi:PAS domain S-box-containing protein